MRDRSIVKGAAKKHLFPVGCRPVAAVAAVEGLDVVTPALLPVLLVPLHGLAQQRYLLLRVLGLLVVGGIAW